MPLHPNEPVSTYEVMTFQDAVQRMALARGAQGTGPELNAMRMAVMDALRELPSKHNWPYYDRILQIATVPPVGDFEATYTHTGGSVERELELASGSWPAYAANGQVQLEDNLYRVEKRISSTVLQLALDSNPGRDVASTSVTWVQTAYNIGQSVRRIVSLSEARSNLSLEYSDQAQFQEFLRLNTSPSTPVTYNIHQSGANHATMEIEFAPPPLDSRVYLVSIEAQPRPLRVYADEMNVTTSGTTVTANTGAFKRYHVGSVIRLSSNSDLPTGAAGFGDDYNPYVEQRVITGFTDASTVTVSSAFDRDWTAVGAVITDPLDLDTVGLWPYFFALSNLKYMQFSPLGPSQGLDQFYTAERMALNTAIANSSRVHSDLIGVGIRKGIPEIDFILDFPTED